MNIPMYGQVPYLQVLHMCKHDKFDVHTREPGEKASVCGGQLQNIS